MGGRVIFLGGVFTILVEFSGLEVEEGPLVKSIVVGEITILGGEVPSPILFGEEFSI